MTIEVDSTLHRAADRRTGIAVTFLGTGIPQEMTASFRFEQGGRSVDFAAGHHVPGSGDSLRASRGLPPSQRVDLLRDIKELRYSVDIAPLGLRSDRDVEIFAAVFKAAAATVGEVRTIQVELTGRNATLPKVPVFRHIRAMLSKD